MTATADRTRQLQAYAVYHASVARWRARQQSAREAEIGRLLTEVVAVLAGVLGEAHGVRCENCGMAKGTRVRTCPNCDESSLVRARRRILAREVAAWERDHPGFNTCRAPSPRRRVVRRAAENRPAAA